MNNIIFGSICEKHFDKLISDILQSIANTEFTNNEISI